MENFDDVVEFWDDFIWDDIAVADDEFWSECEGCWGVNGGSESDTELLEQEFVMERHDWCW